MAEPGNHYEILGIEPAATSEEVEKAYRLCLDLYSDGSLATYSLLDPEELRTARARVEEAYHILRDPQSRSAYDLTQGLAPPVASGSSAPSPPQRLMTLADPVTGAALRRFREERGISLREIAIRSKIGLRFLEYIEQDRHSYLPAPVYLRGFLQEYAKAVGLEPKRTADAYMARLPKRA